MPQTPRLARLLIATLLLAGACRYRYEEIAANSQQNQAGTGNDAGNASSAGNAGTSSATDAGAPGSGGSSTASGGNANTAGSSSTDAGQSPTGGAFAEAGAPGTTGSGGATSTPECSDSADCTCAELDGHAYWFCANRLYWNDASAHCQTAGMDLVRVDSATENTFLVDTGSALGVFAFNNFAQIGADSQVTGGEWRWRDGTLFWQGGSNGSPVAGLYSNWDTSSPSAGGASRCSGVLTSGIWQDRTCTGAEPFVCESP